MHHVVIKLTTARATIYKPKSKSQHLGRKVNWKNVFLVSTGRPPVGVLHALILSVAGGEFHNMGSATTKKNPLLALPNLSSVISGTQRKFSLS